VVFHQAGSGYQWQKHCASLVGGEKRWRGRASISIAASSAARENNRLTSGVRKINPLSNLRAVQEL
jgi:hypothetical protein